MIPPKLAPIVFAFMLSGTMSFFVSGLSTLRAVGLGGEVVVLWMTNWAMSWAIAFPLVVVFAPRVRRFVERNTRKG